MFLAYVSGLLASFSGCTLPVISIMASKISSKSFDALKFVLTFFLSQFVLFALLNLSISVFYTIFSSFQPILLLIVSLLTFSLATANYLGKSISKVPGSIYGIALAPCNLGFAVFQASSSFSKFLAILNAFSFALGIATPLFVIALFSKDLQKQMIQHGKKIEWASFVLLVVISYYLAYLAGSSWRWWP